MPRSKVANHYDYNQLGFVRSVCAALVKIPSLVDGSRYIERLISTRTTHFKTDNGGLAPYVGITTDTCNISDKVKGKSIILVDDVYTGSININEDAIQALFDAGAAEVCLYTVARTVYRNSPEIVQLVA